MPILIPAFNEYLLGNERYVSSLDNEPIEIFAPANNPILFVIKNKKFILAPKFNENVPMLEKGTPLK